MPDVAHIGSMVSGGAQHLHSPAPIATGSSTLFVNSKAVARVTDVVDSSHIESVEIAEGSSVVFDEGLAVARVGDHLACGDVIVDGDDVLNIID